MSRRSRICLYVPALAPRASGNTVTGLRFVRMFRALGHDVSVGAEVTECDVFVALNAYRSAEAVQAFRDAHPTAPLIVVLTGTDLYRYLREDAAPVHATLAAADVLIGFHDLVARDVPEEVRSRVRVILEGTDLPHISRSARVGPLSVAVIGHLRDEKDPLRSALAVRALPQDVSIEVHHYGAAYTNTWEHAARAEMANNPRYRWHGELEAASLRAVYRRSHLVVQSSRIEGGSNVVSEAVASGLPIIATSIPGNVGVLGESYGGYFEMGDTEGLREILLRAYEDRSYLPALCSSLTGLRARVSIERETREWATVLDAVLSPEGKRASLGES